MQEEQVHAPEIKEVDYSKTDWLIFLVTFAGMLALIVWAESRFFWLALPFAATYLVKSLRMM
jgi:hypothetical protein